MTRATWTTGRTASEEEQHDHEGRRGRVGARRTTTTTTTGRAVKSNWRKTLNKDWGPGGLVALFWGPLAPRGAVLGLVGGFSGASWGALVCFWGPLGVSGRVSDCSVGFIVPLLPSLLRLRFSSDLLFRVFLIFLNFPCGFVLSEFTLVGSLWVFPRPAGRGAEARHPAPGRGASWSAPPTFPVQLAPPY